MNLTPLKVSTLVATLCHSGAIYSDPASPLPTHETDDPPQTRLSSTPRLMLAKRYHEGIDPAQYWISEKLDGIRAYWDGQQLRSRQGYPIRAPLWFTQPLPDTPLEGELWIGRGQFDAVSAAARRYQPRNSEWQNIRYRLFDLPASEQLFEQRMQQLLQLSQQIDANHIQPLTYQQRSTHAELQSLLEQQVAQGAEGLMLNRADARYQDGRSDAILKLKSFLDDEARVLAHLPGKGKYQGMLGALRVRTPVGTEFNIGSGFTDQQRRQPPAIGSLISFKYSGLTETGKPRFASFLRRYNDNLVGR